MWPSAKQYLFFQNHSVVKPHPRCLNHLRLSESLLRSQLQSLSQASLVWRAIALTCIFVDPAEIEISNYTLARLQNDQTVPLLQPADKPPGPQ